MRSVMQLLLALLVDVAAGESPHAIHPVVWMGAMTRWLERYAPSRGVACQFAWGLMITVTVPLSFAGAAALLLWAMRSAPLLQVAVGVLLLKSTFALRALGDAAADMRAALAGAQLDAARRALRSLCSRDASTLDTAALVAGTVESLAENASDSFVAPLFYYVVLGVPGAMLYRAVNTLDAMIGYHGQYEYVGKAAARADDLLNLIPARCTAGLLMIAGWLQGCDVRRGWSILRRDGRCTESPNAGYPMATMAGLLGVALEKSGHYRLGDSVEPLSTATIDAAWRLVMYAAAVATLLAVFSEWACADAG